MGVFATDTLFWTEGSGAPSLFDFSQPRDRVKGWKIVYSWREQHSQSGAFDYWYQPSPAVQSDGTLIWTSGAGLTRALRTTGEVKWEAPADEGTLVVTPNDIVIRSKQGNWVAFADDGGARWQAPIPAGYEIPARNLVDEGRYPADVLPTWYGRMTSSSALFVTRQADNGFEVASLDSRDAGFGSPLLIGADSQGSLFVNAFETASTLSLAERSPGLLERWRVPSRELEFAPLVSASGNRLATIDTQCRVNLLDRQTGRTLATHRLAGRPGRYLPRLLDGVLYVVAELRPAVTVKPSEMEGRARPDGGTINASDYGCYVPLLLGSVFCPSIEANDRRRVFALYAFQVE